MLARWCGAGGAEELERRGSSAEQMMEQTRGNVLVSREQSDVLVDWYLESVASAPVT
jgi:hypothetical protein